MSEPEPWPDESPKNGETYPDPVLTPAEQDRAFNAQLILFAVMGIFIILPFILWWWLFRR